MDNAGQIGVELRLLMSQLPRDIKVAVAAIQSELAKASKGIIAPAVSGSGAESVKATEGVKRHTSAVQGLTSALKEQNKAALEAWRAAQVPPVVRNTEEELAAARKAGMADWQGEQGKPFEGGVAAPAGIRLITRDKAAALRALEEREGRRTEAEMKEEGIRLREKGEKEAAPAVPKQPLPSSRTVTFATMFHGVTNMALSPFTQMAAKAVAALAAFRVAMGLIQYAVRMALTPLNLMVHAFQALLQVADRAARLYSSALTTGGLSLGFVARRNALAQIIGVGENEVWQYGKAIMFLNKELDRATRAIIGTTPVLTSLSWHWRSIRYDMEALKTQLAAAFEPAVNAVLIVLKNFTQGLLASAKAIRFGLDWLTPVGLAMGPLKLLSKKAPEPEAWSRRLPTSQWERMGLVLGIGGGENPARDTAKNTAKTVSVLEKIAQMMNTSKPQYPYMKWAGAAMP